MDSVERERIEMGALRSRASGAPRVPPTDGELLPANRYAVCPYVEAAFGEINGMSETARYVHQPIGEEVRAIGGAYTLEKEIKLLHGGREVLVVLGQAIIDSSCCGVGGFRYAFVPGYLQGWHDQESEKGLPISTVRSICEETERRAIEETIRGRELIHSIEFW